MTTEWKDLTTLQAVATAQANGWEIEVVDGAEVEEWNGLYWHKNWQFRARPKQPKMKKVKMLCWLAEGHHLEWLLDGEEGYAEQAGWIRIPAQDIEIEVPDDN